MIMKTLEDLKAFSLDKKQMNQIEGGRDAQECARLQEEASNGSVEDWDAWADAVEAAC